MRPMLCIAKCPGQENQISGAFNFSLFSFDVSVYNIIMNCEDTEDEKNI